MRHTVLALWICAVLGCGRSIPGVPLDPVPAAVPEGYRTLYAELESELSLLNPVFSSLWGAKAGATAFGVELPETAGHRAGRPPGDERLSSAATTLDRLRAIGVKIVCLNVPYPLLTREPPQHSQHRDFFRNLAGEIRQRGFLLVVAIGVLPRAPESAAPPKNSAGLTRTRFNTGLREMAETILADLRPDYLTVLSGPDAVAQHTGLPFPPAEFAATVRHVVQGLDAGAVKLGAGAGTWTALDYLKALGAIPELHYLDLHIHLIRYGFAYDRLIQAADIARARGKKIAIGAAWLRKESSREFGRLGRTEVLAREVFSFWQPLDRRFVETTVAIAHTLAAEFCTFSRPELFFSALEYTEEAGRMSRLQLLQLAEDQAADGAAAGALTPAGKRFSELIGDPAPELMLDTGAQTP
ncbi:MAG: hypothetical protein MUD16_05910 [Desulfobacterales bacterium]|nr:hypothetical protein [Desulfobacterales bacterium]